jgi:hypothetical protein
MQPIRTRWTYSSLHHGALRASGAASRRPATTGEEMDAWVEQAASETGLAGPRHPGSDHAETGRFSAHVIPGATGR